MIEQKELRLGNYVHGNPYNGYITVFSNDKCVIKHKSGIERFRIKDLQPIPLTEEMLLNCGFEKTFEGGTLWYLGKFFVSSLDFIYWSDIKIVYLHQLQNIYWCLHGKELEVNL